MKMVSRILSQVEGMETLAIVAMILFLAMFLGVALWLITLKRGHFRQASLMPLDEDASDENLMNENRNQ